MPTDWNNSALVNNLYIANQMYEPETVAFLKRHVKKGDVVLDVGANFGYYSVLFSHLVGHGWVHAFEPYPERFEVLKMNTHSRRNIVPHRIAISDRIQTTWFYKNRSYGRGGLIPQGKMDGRFRVETDTLDNLKFKRVDWVKIDVEGHEGEVIAGLRDTIERNPGVRLIIEFMPKRGLADCFWDVLDGFEFRNLDHNVLAYREVDKRPKKPHRENSPRMICRPIPPWYETHGLKGPPHEQEAER